MSYRPFSIAFIVTGSLASAGKETGKTGVAFYQLGIACSSLRHIVPKFVRT